MATKLELAIDAARNYDIERVIKLLEEALAEPELNLNCKSVQKRLATVWGYVKAEQAEQEPVAWKHDCAALCTNGVELWVDRCPHCGKPSAAPQPVKQEPVWSVEECDRVIKTLRYIQGIAERGFGRAMREDETIEQFVLGYVKQLEAAPVRTKDLTDDEVFKIIDDFSSEYAEILSPKRFARAVIAKFKEKNK